MKLFVTTLALSLAARLQFKPRADYRLIVSEMTLAR